MAILQSDGVNNATDLILRRNGTEGLRLTSSTVQLQSINNGPLAGFRNAIINGNFDIWQRGTSFTGSGYGYGADRWVNARTGTTHTVTRQAFTLGQTDVPGEPTYFYRTVVSSVAGSSNRSVLAQPIESVRTFAGQQITISFWAKANATKNIALDLSQLFGSGGSPSPSVDGIGTTKISIGTTWQKVTVTANVPSISGKTLGTDNNSSINLNIWFDAGSSFNARTNSLGHQSGTFDIAQVQVEAGPVATPFERRPIGTEVALCQRYYERIVFGGDGYAGIAGAIRGGTATYAVTKRGIPSLTFDGMSYSNASSATPQNLGDPNTGFIHFAIIPVVANFFYNGVALADAEL